MADVTLGGLGEPATHAVAITPNSAADIAVWSRALWIGSIAGGTDLVVTTVDDVDGQFSTFAGLAAGTLLPIRVKRIWATSTVSSILNLY
jgi:hypothetical protein